MLFKNKYVVAYEKKIKIIVASNITYIKKRLNIFPKNTLRKLNKMKLDKTIEVSGKSYTSGELTKLVLSKQKELTKETSVSSYSEVLKSFSRECSGKNMNQEQYNEIYEKYQGLLRDRLKTNKDDLYFCLDALKAIEKSFKE
jgi:hypothetical protein